jgi:integrase
MSLRKTKYPGVYRYKSRIGRPDVYGAKIYDPSVPSGQKWIGTFETARGAREAKLDAERERDGRASKAQVEQTHAEYERVWLERHPRGRSSESTLRSSIKPFIREFGDRRLGDLTRVEAREWAVSTNRSHVRTARSMLNDAIDDGLIEHNPFATMRLRQSTGRRYVRPPAPEVVLDLAEIAGKSGRPFGPLVRDVILFGFGSLMRPNEIGALRREDVDFKNKVIRVSQGMDRWAGINATKTGRRSMIALTPLAEQALRRADRYLPRDRETMFLNPSGDILRTQTLDGYFREVRSLYAGKTGDRSVHEATIYLITRHAGASFMRNELGIRPDDIEMQLRHESSNLVDTYSHPSERQAIDRILSVWPNDLRAYFESRS